MSPEAVRAAVEEFASRVDSCTPEDAMRAAIDRALRVNGFRVKRQKSELGLPQLCRVVGRWRDV